MLSPRVPLCLVMMTKRRRGHEGRGLAEGLDGLHGLAGREWMGDGLSMRRHPWWLAHGHSRQVGLPCGAMVGEGINAHWWIGTEIRLRRYERSKEESRLLTPLTQS